MTEHVIVIPHKCHNSFINLLRLQVQKFSRDGNLQKKKNLCTIITQQNTTYTHTHTPHSPLPSQLVLSHKGEAEAEEPGRKKDEKIMEEFSKRFQYLGMAGGGGGKTKHKRRHRIQVSDTGGGGEGKGEATPWREILLSLFPKKTLFFFIKKRGGQGGKERRFWLRPILSLLRGKKKPGHWSETPFYWRV